VSVTASAGLTLWVCGVLQALPDKPEGGLVPPFLLVYIATIPGFSGVSNSPG